MKKHYVLSLILIMIVLPIISACLSASVSADNKDVMETQNTQTTKPIVENITPPEQPEVKNLGNGRIKGLEIT